MKFATSRFLFLPLAFAASGCGNAPPPEADPAQVERYLASLEVEQAAAAPADVGDEKDKKEKSFRADDLVKTLDRSLPEDISPVAAEAILKNAG
jgi:hypothetical protein